MEKEKRWTPIGRYTGSCGKLEMMERDMQKLNADDIVVINPAEEMELWQESQKEHPAADSDRPKEHEDSEP